MLIYIAFLQQKSLTETFLSGSDCRKSQAKAGLFLISVVKYMSRELIRNAKRKQSGTESNENVLYRQCFVDETLIKVYIYYSTKYFVASRYNR